MGSSEPVDVVPLADPTFSGYPTNPYLDYRPIFARSLPVQILLTGITLTLASILLIQLVFSAPTHIRIARTNFYLQLFAALALLAWEIASLVLILNAAVERSYEWPFMLDYVAIDFPPLIDPRTHSAWSDGGLAAWLFMNAVVSVLTQMTHIQFLTLMYPSRLEAYLIFILLGPLSIMAALTQFAPLHPNLSFISTTSDARNVCNATLMILFTISLSIWGFIVNRKQAWRTDGGTAAFGVGAILLAFASTGLTILYIPSQNQFEWIPGLTSAIVLWQSFFGWWWWVGAGMGMGEVDVWLKRAEKRRKRRIAREARMKERNGRLREAWNAMTRSSRTSSSSTAMEKPPRTSNGSSDSDAFSPFSKLDDTPMKGQQRVNENDDQGSSYWPWSIARSAYRHVRNAHVTAARRNAIERAEHIRGVFGVDGSVTNVPATSGWALGSFGIREREAAEAAFEMEGTGQLVYRSRGGAREVAVEAGMKQDGEREDEPYARPKTYETGYPHGQPQTKQTAAETYSSSSLWWWGPLRRWRLQDATEYSERH
ncbi:hypothetical protein F5148DRAFT_1355687 [Russula earlei]|uniref:Uncharacterized protein n=1 Tax=Russula earlei TaxID=71964 RepID=A0ACC0U9N0_9AGAM|nr:hypothetical protein F5148DRAFT_1355687 [Russula earlei]